MKADLSGCSCSALVIVKQSRKNYSRSTRRFGMESFGDTCVRSLSQSVQFWPSLPREIVANLFITVTFRARG